MKHGLYVLCVSFLFLGCNAAKFSTKAGTLAKAVMGPSNATGEGNGIKNETDGNLTQAGGGDAEGGLGQNGGGDEADGRLNQPDGTNDEVDIELLCSDSRSEDNINFKRAVAEGLPITLAVDKQPCTSSVSEIQALVAKKKFTLDDAKRLCPALVPASGKWASVEIFINGKSTPSKKGVITLLYARNEDTSVDAEAADAMCDQRKSPLVIHVASDVNNPLPIALSSQDKGVYFDIAGRSNNHVPLKISWFTNHDYRLLTLPDSRGRVRGIDQLFGDNTVGPDGKAASDGYAALAKYDSNGDGTIDSKDPVFSQLRLWLDKDFDGVARARELSSLSSVGLVYIDLDYSTDYAETDRYGNQTTMKSIVGYQDGSMDLIFDLWFNVK